MFAKDMVRPPDVCPPAVGGPGNAVTVQNGSVPIVASAASISATVMYGTSGDRPAALTSAIFGFAAQFRARRQHRDGAAPRPGFSRGGGRRATTDLPAPIVQQTLTVVEDVKSVDVSQANHDVLRTDDHNPVRPFATGARADHQHTSCRICP